MTHTFGPRHLIGATASAIRRQGRAMLAAAPWSLAVFTLTLPLAVMVGTLYGPLAWVLLVSALANLIAFSRMAFAWHRVIVLEDAARIDSVSGGTGQARHLVLLGALAIAAMVLARMTGDLPYLLYMVMDAPPSTLFLAVLIVVILLVWLPLLYGLAVIGLSLPRSAVTGEYGLVGIRDTMRYPRWPLMLGLAAMIALGGLAHGQLFELVIHYTDTGLAWSLLYVVSCVAATFVVMAMYAVAYRDSTSATGATCSA